MRKILTLVLLVVVAMSVSGCYPAIAHDDGYDA